MLKIETCLLWALAAWSLLEGSVAEDLRPEFVCLLDDPSPNLCDSFCLNALQPLIIETKAKLNGLEGQQFTMETKLEDRLKALETKVEEDQAKQEGNLLAALAKMEAQLQTIINKINASQPAVPPGFQQIGERYFRFVEKRQDWDSAAKTCREMGGYLAAFRNLEELNAGRAKLPNKNTEYWSSSGYYWTGINDRDKKGHFVSVASNKKAAVFDPLNKPENVSSCIVVDISRMVSVNCRNTFNFICQSDNET